MSEFIQIRLLSMFDRELEQIKGMISNETIWAASASYEEETAAHAENIRELEEYRALLKELREKVNNGESI